MLQRMRTLSSSVRIAARIPRIGSQVIFSRTAGTAPIRDERFSQLTEADISFFRNILGDTGLITDESSLEAYNHDWMGKYTGASKLALRPKTTEQVSKILAYCNERTLAVVPQGGNTGLVGGSIPIFDEVILSTSSMNQIESVDEVGGTVVCQSGAVLESIANHVADYGFTVPLDLGAKGSCQIGGNVSTNAGGLRLLRYGSLHGTVLGLEVVTPTGEVLDLLRTLRKDNTGYDLKQLFIGAEGTLGVITKVAMLLPPKSSAVHVSLLAVPHYKSVQDMFTKARAQLGEILSAFEFLDRESMDMCLTHLDWTKDPMPETPTPFYVLIETSGSNAEHDMEKLEAFLESMMEEELIENGIIAQDEAQAQSIWHLREGVTEALGRAGAVYKYDLSMPVSTMYTLVEDMRVRLGDKGHVVGYGHLGDGNLHLNISCPTYTPEVEAMIEPFVYEWTSEQRGSISAEHGIGSMKAECLGYSKSKPAIDLMKQIKKSMDPNGIMNPYKVLPQSSDA